MEYSNCLREEFGLNPKMTIAEKKELQKLEERERLREAEREAEREAIKRNSAKQAKRKAEITEQMDMLAQLKDLLDMGVLIQEEFDQKKKEIMDI